jgi:ketosteroid isomerase-like protein
VDPDSRRLNVLSLRACLLALAAAASVVLAGAAPPKADTAELARQVRDAERGFAKTMSDRDHAAFTTFLAEEAVFFGETRVHRGKQAVADAWKALYQAPEAPFSWEPEQVEVLDSGTLAHSSGPVHDATGKRAGTFNSVWRREADGRWRVVFDKGCPRCECK